MEKERGCDLLNDNGSGISALQMGMALSFQQVDRGALIFQAQTLSLPSSPHALTVALLALLSAIRHLLGPAADSER